MMYGIHACIRFFCLWHTTHIRTYLDIKWCRSIQLSRRRSACSGSLLFWWNAWDPFNRSKMLSDWIDHTGSQRRHRRRPALDDGEERRRRATTVLRRSFAQNRGRCRWSSKPPPHPTPLTAFSAWRRSRSGPPPLASEGPDGIEREALWAALEFESRGRRHKIKTTTVKSSPRHPHAAPAVAFADN